MSLTLCLIFG